MRLSQIKFLHPRALRRTHIYMVRAGAALLVGLSFALLMACDLDRGGDERPRHVPPDLSRQVVVTSHNAAGDFTHFLLYQYDVNGNLRSVGNYTPSGMLNAYEFYTYAYVGGATQIRVGFYDAMSNLTRYEVRRCFAAACARMEFASIAFYDTNGNLTRYTTATYDELGRQHYHGLYGVDGNLTGYELYNYTGRQTRPARISQYAIDGVFDINGSLNVNGTLLRYRLYRYDSVRPTLLLSLASYRADHLLTSYVNYTYDAEGRRQRIDFYTGNGNLSRYEAYGHDPLRPPSVAPPDQTPIAVAPAPSVARPPPASEPPGPSPLPPVQTQPPPPIRVVSLENRDGDQLADVVDNCPVHTNPDQLDGDDDGVGDACEVQPITDLAIAGIGNRAVNLTWVNPAGSNLTALSVSYAPRDAGYTITLDPTRELSLAAGARVRYLVQRLQPDTNYTFTVSGRDFRHGRISQVLPPVSINATTQALPMPPSAGDSDGDGIPNARDNCPTVSNPAQEQNYGDPAIGDACEDTDNDGHVDAVDNCPTTPNAPQAQNYGDDAIGDACEDTDADGIYDLSDNCALVPNRDQANNFGDRTNRNGTGDACEDSDGDGFVDSRDNCPRGRNPDQMIAQIDLATRADFLQHIPNPDSAACISYQLRADLTFSAADDWTPPDLYSIFDGNGHTITGLSAALFNMIRAGAQVNDIGIRGNILAEQNAGRITSVYATGSVSRNGRRAPSGGLVNINTAAGQISHSHATGNVTGSSYTGGLVGHNSGRITHSYATGRVMGSQSGGLVGHNDSPGLIMHSYATGAVGSSTSRFSGGLVGVNDNDGRIIASNASGPVVGTLAAGGLVGINNFRGVLMSVVARGDSVAVLASGGSAINTHVGGLVGINQGGQITRARAHGHNPGGTMVGGLVGLNSHGGNISSSYASGNNGLDGWSTYVGGLIGRHLGGGSISNSYALGHNLGYITGGLVGEHIGGLIVRSYATGNSNGSAGGGLVGHSGVASVLRDTYAVGNSFGRSEGGGLVAWNDGTVHTSYAAGRGASAGQRGGLVSGHRGGGTVLASYRGQSAGFRFGAFRNAAQLRCPTEPGDARCDPTTYLGWDAGSWDFGDSNTLPTLRDLPPCPSFHPNCRHAPADPDYDGAPGLRDNCPALANADQKDTDGDGDGDACDFDIDGDGHNNTVVGVRVPNPTDNCPTIANRDQANTITPDNARGDACDDLDGDGIYDRDDNCPATANRNQRNTISPDNAEGDACDDTDQDGTNDLVDNCPLTPNADQANDFGNAQLGDACEDTDGDTHLDRVDNCPLDANPSQARGQTVMIGTVADLRSIPQSGVPCLATYELTANLLLTNGASWTPITNFSGLFQGNDHSITGLPTPLFGNLSITANVTRVGVIGNILAERNAGMIEHSYATGDDNHSRYSGGLVRYNARPGIIYASYATGAVGNRTGRFSGGLVGYNAGRIDRSYARGPSSGFISGGLVGYNGATGTLIRSYASGASNGRFSGGLVGYNDHRGDIVSCSATGSSSGRYGAGLVGYNRGDISHSYASGDAEGSHVSGGLVGQNHGAITHSYARGTSASYFTGGLVGVNYVGSVIQYANASGLSVGHFSGGLVGTSAGKIDHAIATGDSRGVRNSGGLVGENNGIIEYSHASGMSTSNNSGEFSFSGGLVGENNHIIRHSYASGTSTGRKSGGLVGENRHPNGVISDTYALGNSNASQYGGGLVGRNMGRITRSYAIGDSLGAAAESHGGLVGYNAQGSITDAYATGTSNARQHSGGLIGYHAAGVIHNTYALGSSFASYRGGLIGVSGDGTLVVASSYRMQQTPGRLYGGLRTLGQFRCPQEPGDSNCQPTSYTGWNSTIWNFGNARTLPTLAGLPACPASQPNCRHSNVATVVATVSTDSDNDGISDTNDNCPTIANGNQANTHSPDDNEGDACDDTDLDGSFDSVDNCPLTANRDQRDSDRTRRQQSSMPADGGDACDDDDDDDGHLDAVDLCPIDYNPNQDRNAAITIATKEQLQNIPAQVSCLTSYRLTADLVLSDADRWTPIADFHGIFDGNGRTLTLPARLFDTLHPSARVRQLGIINSTLAVHNAGHIRHTYATGPSYLSGDLVASGGLVNTNAETGQIDHSHATGNITGYYSGGLVGQNHGRIAHAYARGDTRGHHSGGLVGSNAGNVTHSYATGFSDGYDSGGLVGNNLPSGIVMASNASGRTNGYRAAGGLVGFNDFGVVMNVSASGETVGEKYVGGLVGWNFEGSIRHARASGPSISRQGSVGGLVGLNGGPITHSYASGNSSSPRAWIGYSVGNAGGLVGWNYGGDISYSYALGNSVGFYSGGLIGRHYDGLIANSYATGHTNGTGAGGGLVGLQLVAAIRDSYASGNSFGGQESGGLVGNIYDGTVINAYALGSSTGPAGVQVGGLIGVLNGIAANYAVVASYRMQGAGGLGEHRNVVQLRCPSTPGDSTCSPTTYNGWNNATWDFGNRTALPTLRNMPACPPSHPDCRHSGHQTADPDSDDDGYDDVVDNCPAVANPGQEQTYGDASIGDACEDTDRDGWVDANDNCPTTANNDQTNTDAAHDDFGDACDDDDDNDGIPDTRDNCPLFSNPSQVQTVTRIAIATEADLRRIHHPAPCGPTIYTLMVNLSFDNTDRWTSANFHSIFNGNNHTIAGLSAPLFDTIRPAGRVTNVGILDNILANRNEGLVAHAYATGNVDVRDQNAGGLIHVNSGTINHSYATGNVNIFSNSYGSAGGLVGYNTGTIRSSYAAGRVTSTVAGGLVGLNLASGRIIQSYALGDSSSPCSTFGCISGGLVGQSRGGVVIRSYALGNSRGGVSGGLVGLNTGYDNNHPSRIIDSYAAGRVTGSYAAGGLVGWNIFSSVTRSYATGTVIGESGTFAGGLIGRHEIGIRTDYATVSSYRVHSAGTDGGDGDAPRSLIQLRCPTMANATCRGGSNTYEGWDGTIWAFGTSNDLPTLLDLPACPPSRPHCRHVRAGLVDPDGSVDNDTDGDGHGDMVDNCRTVANPDQQNGYGSADLGDACEDSDGDGHLDLNDNCPTVPNRNQMNTYGSDDLGDVCEDTDNDGWIDANDNCPMTANNDQTNTDATHDDLGDACDDDDDNDGIPDTRDNCPLFSNPSQVQTVTRIAIATEADLRRIHHPAPCGPTIYTLMVNLSFDNTDRWTSANFHSIFNGNNHTIAGLSAPLFDTIRPAGRVTNVGILDNILANRNEGLVAHAYATGNVDVRDQNAGGLIHVNSGTINHSYATGNVNIFSNSYGSAGGLVGYNTGTIRSSYAAGRVTSTVAGGLVGLNLASGRIIQSYALGDSSSPCSTFGCISGGLVGQSRGGVVIRSYALGNSRGGVSGGLVGLNTGYDNNHPSRIIDSYAAGRVTGSYAAGGLVGWNIFSSVTRSYATGTVIGESGTFAGGLIGRHEIGIRTDYATVSSYRVHSAGTDGGDGDAPRSLIQLRCPTMANATCRGGSNTYEGWDGTIWAFGTASDLPTLRAMPACPTFRPNCRH